MKNYLVVLPGRKEDEQMQNKEIKIRLASPKDAADLLKIYAPYVEKTADQPPVKPFPEIL